MFEICILWKISCEKEATRVMQNEKKKCSLSIKCFFLWNWDIYSCIDDPNGDLATIGQTCDYVIQMSSCGTLLSEINANERSGATVADICPQSCSNCSYEGIDFIHTLRMNSYCIKLFGEMN